MQEGRCRCWVCEDDAAKDYEPGYTTRPGAVVQAVLRGEMYAVSVPDMSAAWAAADEARHLARTVFQLAYGKFRKCRMCGGGNNVNTRHCRHCDGVVLDLTGYAPPPVA